MRIIHYTVWTGMLYILILLFGIHDSNAFYINSPFPSISQTTNNPQTNAKGLPTEPYKKLTDLTPCHASASNILSKMGSKTGITYWTMDPIRFGLHSNPIFVISSMCLLSTFGLALEKDTNIGKALSAPLVTMAVSLLMANLGFIPFKSSIYTTINQYLVPLAVPLLLYESNLRNILTNTGSLLLAFLIGSLSSILATLLTYAMLPLSSLGSEGWKVACALAARHIGGAINFVSVSETLGIGGTYVSAAIAADNVVVALYFAFLFWIAKPAKESEVNETPIRMEPNVKDNITTLSMSTSLMIASFLVLLGNAITLQLAPKGTSSLPFVSLLTILLVTLSPKVFTKLTTTGTAIGILFMQLFFAVSGASGSISLVIQSAPILFLFSSLQVVIQFGLLVGIGKFVYKLEEKELVLASNANIGGPTTAAAMAQVKGWPELVGPSLMIGILGYVMGTPLALSLAKVLRCV